MRRIRFGLATVGILLASAASGQNAKPLPGGTEISVVGLEDTLTKLQSLQTRNAAQAALFLQIIKGIGQKGATTDGRSRYEYRIQVTDGGGVLINGIDIVPILNAANAAK